MNVKDFGLIYAGAQKNMSCAGVATVIVRKDVLGHVSHPSRRCSTSTHIPGHSIFQHASGLRHHVMNRVLNFPERRRHGNGKTNIKSALTL